MVKLQTRVISSKDFRNILVPHESLQIRSIKKILKENLQIMNLSYLILIFINISQREFTIDSETYLNENFQIRNISQR